MGRFPGFSVWINQNTQQPPKAESKISDENVKPKSKSKKDSKIPKVYFDIDEQKKQLKLWHKAEKKHPWYDAPPRVKVTTEKGICHMKIEFTLGLPPETVYDHLINPIPFQIDHLGRSLVEEKARKILKEDGPREVTETDKAVAVDFLWWSVDLPIKLIVDTNQKDLTTKYKKEKMMFMKMFEGSYKVGPIYVDAERLCKHNVPKNQEEYKKCSGGQGKIASKVVIDQYFQPSPPFNLPPVSWYIRGIIINTTKTLLQALQLTGATLREISREEVAKTPSNKHGKH